MKKSLLLKDRNGNVAACLTQADERMMFATREPLFDSAVLIMTLDDKGSHRISVCGDGTEHIYPAAAAPVRHACVVDPDGEVLLSDCREDFAVSAGQPGKSANPASESPARNEQAPVPAEMERFIPCLRWPRPACMPEGRYIGGKWR